MKHLISLSIKYIRRRKLRSTLTFLCITLSVFILCSIAAYSSSIFTTLKNDAAINDGSWEVDLSDLIDPDLSDAEAMKENKINDVKKAADILANHAVVDTMYIADFVELVAGVPTYPYNGYYGEDYSPNDHIDGESKSSKFAVSFDGKNERDLVRIKITASAGTPSIMPKIDKYGDMVGENNIPVVSAEDGAYLPEFVHTELGYNVGDRINITVTPVIMKYDRSSKEAKAFIEKLRAINADSDEDTVFILTDVFPKDEQRALFEQVEREERFVCNGTLYEIAERFPEYSSDERPVIPELEDSRFEPVSFEYTIEGFSDNNQLTIFCSAANIGCADKLVESLRDCSLVYTDRWDSCRLRIKDSVDFDGAVKQLVNDLGADYSRLGPNTIRYNSELLSFELKGADAIAGLIIYIMIAVVVLLISWAFVRFIIDNTFEISVSERSSEFAALRVMGASKAQLTALIMTEAVFYCITAVPLGAVTAFLSCRSIFAAFRYGGIRAAEFSVMPLFAAIGIILSVLSIFISAFTSSIWAARKLSPAEAMSFGKPVSQKKKLKPRRSRLNRGSKGTVFHYTLRNVFGKKSRFVFVSIAMALGVSLFTTCTLAGLYLKDDYSKLVGDNEYEFDYMLGTSDFDKVAEFHEKFDNNKNFSKAYASSSLMRMCGKDSPGISAMTMLPTANTSLLIEFIEQPVYDKFIKPLNKMSYEEFESSGCALAYRSPLLNDKGEIFSTDLKDRLVPEDYYKPVSEFGFGEPPTLGIAAENASDAEKEVKVSGVVCCEVPVEWHQATTLIMPISRFPEFGVNGEYHRIGLTLVVSSPKNAESAYNEVCDFYSTGLTYMDDNYQNMTGYKALIKAIVSIALIFVISMWSAGVFSMISVINTSVLNRSRELAMIRSIGMTRKQLVGTVVLESVMFSLFSTILGIIGGSGLFCFFISQSSEDALADLITKNAGIFLAAAPIVFAVCMAVAVLAAVPAVKSLKKRIL